MKSLFKNLAKAMRLSLALRDSVVLFKTRMIPYKRLIKILKCNLILFKQTLKNLLAHAKLSKPPLSIVVKDAIILMLMLFVLKANIPMLSKCL
jgi:hypothetical protein